MRIALGSDHRGVEAVKALAVHLNTAGHRAEILSDTSGEPTDYPDAAWVVATAVATGRADRGVLVCSSGIGVCIAANKVPGARAALVHDEKSASLSRHHNDANVLCLPEDLTDSEVARVVDVWLREDFETGGRHERRVGKIAAIERGEDPRRLDQAPTQHARS